MKELREYEQRNQKKRNLRLRQLEAIINAGLPVSVKLTTKVYLPADQYESMPSTHKAEDAALIEMNAQSDISINTVTTEYHDSVIEEATKACIEQITIFKERISKLKAFNIEVLERAGKFEKLYEQETNNTTKYREDIANWKKDWDGLCNKNKKLVQKCEELMQLLDYATAPKGKKQIKAIDNRAIVKKVEEKPGDEPDPFAKVRETRFYGDTGPSKPKGYPAFPKFKGHSLRKGKWIFVKHPLEEHLANDEKPRLNIRSIRPQFALLTTHEVWQVRRYIESGRKNNWIEKRLGITDAASSTMRTGKSYLKIPPEPKMKSFNKVKPVTVHAGEGVITQDKHKSLFD